MAKLWRHPSRLPVHDLVVAPHLGAQLSNVGRIDHVLAFCCRCWLIGRLVTFPYAYADTDPTSQSSSRGSGGHCPVVLAACGENEVSGRG